MKKLLILMLLASLDLIAQVGPKGLMVNDAALSCKEYKVFIT